LDFFEVFLKDVLQPCQFSSPGVFQWNSWPFDPSLAVIGIAVALSSSAGSHVFIVYTFTTVNENYSCVSGVAANGFSAVCHGLECVVVLITQRELPPGSTRSTVPSTTTQASNASSRAVLFPGSS